MDGATSRGIPSDAKLESNDEGEILHVSGQSDIEIYMIGSTPMYMPSPMINGWPRTELQRGEFPQRQN